MASYVSAILVLGYPAEMYAFGGQWILHAVGTAIGAALACVLFVPLFYPLKLTSINEVSVSYAKSSLNPYPSIRIVDKILKNVYFR